MEKLGGFSSVTASDKMGLSSICLLVHIPISKTAKTPGLQSLRQGFSTLRGMQSILRGRWKPAILPDPHALHYLRKGSRRYTKCNFSKGAQCFKKVENSCCRVSCLGLVTLRFLETLFIRSQVDSGDFYSGWNQRTK